jgi:hypothetical protein
MLVVVDNGDVYSSHALYFFETTLAPPVVVGIVALLDKEKAHLVLTTDVAEWAPGISPMTIAAYIEDKDYKLWNVEDRADLYAKLTGPERGEIIAAIEAALKPGIERYK